MYRGSIFDQDDAGRSELYDLTLRAASTRCTQAVFGSLLHTAPKSLTCYYPNWNARLLPGTAVHPRCRQNSEEI
jgi:hypothetical protein